MDQFRPGFDADGFDLAVDSIGPDGVVIVRIGHRPDAWRYFHSSVGRLLQHGSDAYLQKMRQAAADVGK